MAVVAVGHDVDLDGRGGLHPARVGAEVHGRPPQDFGPIHPGLNARGESARSAPSAADTFAAVITAIESLIDGTYAATLGDLRLLATPNLHAFLASLRVSDNTNESAVTYLRRETGGYRVSEYAPADTNSDKTHDLLVRRGSHPGAALLPSWGSRLYEDTQSATGVGRKLFVVRVANVFVPQSAAAEGNRADWKRVGIRSSV